VSHKIDFETLTQPYIALESMGEPHDNLFNFGEVWHRSSEYLYVDLINGPYAMRVDRNGNADFFDPLYDPTGEDGKYSGDESRLPSDEEIVRRYPYPFKPVWQGKLSSKTAGDFEVAAAFIRKQIEEGRTGLKGAAEVSQEAPQDEDVSVNREDLQTLLSFFESMNDTDYPTDEEKVAYDRLHAVVYPQEAVVGMKR
jgi:hypothetical protein